MAARQFEKDRSRRHKKNLKSLSEMEENIRVHEERLEALGWKLGDPELHKDPEGLRLIEADRAEIQEAVRGLYEQWERLSAEVEAGDQVSG
jgi:protein subunit release factor A